MRKPRGFALVIALLLTTLLLVLGLAFLSKQSSRYRLARLTSEAVIAKGLALAGMETTRVKLETDLLFPPPDYRFHDEYSYSEQVRELNGPKVVGTYEVTIDRRWQDPPYEIVVVTAEGHPVNSDARYRIRAELDVCETPPRNFFRWIRWEENAVY
jgi:hypothetical protein